MVIYFIDRIMVINIVLVFFRIDFWIDVVIMVKSMGLMKIN